jgi:hypothetical protein
MHTLNFHIKDCHKERSSKQALFYKDNETFHHVLHNKKNIV